MVSFREVLSTVSSLVDFSYFGKLQVKFVFNIHVFKAYIKLFSIIPYFLNSFYRFNL